MNSPQGSDNDFTRTARISILPSGTKSDAVLFRLAFECAADAMFIAELDGRIIEANQSAARWLGYTIDELRGISPSQFDVFVDFPSTMKEINKRKELRFETVWNTRKGTKLPVELYCRLANVGDRKFILAIARDISDRKAAELMQRNAQAELERLVQERTEELMSANKALHAEALQRKSTEFQYRSLFDFNETLLSALDALVIASDSEGRIMRFNRACERLSGWRSEEVMGRHFWELLVPAEKRLKAAGEYASYLADPRRMNAESEFLLRNGERRWISWIHSAMMDSNGRPEMVISCGFDITERHVMEERIRVSERKYRSLYENMRDAFVVVDMAGHLIEYNKAYREMLGYEDGELAQLTYVQITPEKWHSMEAEVIASQVIPRGYSDIYRKEYRRKDGVIIPIELRTILQLDEEGRPHSMWAIIRQLAQDRIQSNSSA